MEKLNMANMSTLFRKGYLLAGVVMLLNMFVVKEVMAMEGGSTGNPFSSELQMNPNSNNELNNNSTNIEGYRRIEGTESEKLDVTEDQFAPSILDELLYRLLFWENRINFFGGIIVSGFNNYLKLWDYNPGIYFKVGCLGWRSKSLLNGIFQFDINLNLGRGVLWTTFFWLNYTTMPKIMIIARLIVEFISIPLAIHIHGFDISIAFDSILFTVVNRHILSYLLSRLTVFKDNEEIKDDNSIDIKRSPEEIDYYSPQQNNNNNNNFTSIEKLDDSSSNPT